MEHIEDLKNALRRFAPFSDSDLANLDALFSFKKFKKNDFLLRQHHRARYSVFIVDGAFREFYSDKNGREYNKVFCFKGDFTGSYYDLESNQPSNVSIQALSDSSVLMMLHEQYANLALTDPLWTHFAYSFTRALLMKKFEKEFQLLTLSAQERYALLQKENPALENLVPAYHIASYLGITPISFSRIRAQRMP